MRKEDKKNNLTAIKFVKVDKYGNQFWLFKCNCGNIKLLRMQNVISRNTKSCGCLNSKIVRKRMTTHGMSKTNFFRVFQNIKNRCYRKNDPSYFRYGARNIKCLWASFEEFKKDMYQSYLDHVKKHGIKGRNTSIERIDNNGDYCKENCRWATRREQARNRRSNVHLLFNGRNQLLTEWAEEVGIDRDLISGRIKSGWTTEETLTTK